MSVNWTDAQLKAAGIPKRRLMTLLRRLEDADFRLRELGLMVYAESGTCHLIHPSRPTHDTRGKADHGSPVASVGCLPWDGGAW